MKDDRALLAAIQADPDDDLPRLAYADWCDERGDPARAELIRVQTSCMKLPVGPERTALAQRAETLLREHEKTWRAALPSIEGVKWGRFERGFVTHVSTDGVTFRRAARRVFAAAPVSSLGLPLKGARKFAAGVPEARRLTHLGLHTPTDKGDDEIRAACESPHFPRLLELNVGSAQLGPLAARALAECPRLDRLRTLNAYLNRIGDEGLSALAGSPHLRALRQLNAHSNGVGRAGAEALASSESLAGLADLHFGDVIGPEGVRALANSRTLTNLRELSLSDRGYGAAGMIAIAEGPALAGLTLLNLQAPSGRDGGIALAESPHLRRLDTLLLFNCHFGDEGVSALARSPILQTVRCLNLSHNDLTDVGARALAESPYLDNLDPEHLVLVSNPITRAGTSLLYQRFRDPRLRPTS